MINKKIEQKQEKQIIDCEPLIAGALLKFNSIDAIDFSLLVEDFQEKNNVIIRGEWYDNIGNYIKLEKDSILLREDYSLDYFIKEENRTLREKLLEVAGNMVIDYFKNINVKSYYHKKAKDLQENKNRVLKDANVLLISENKEDYDELVKYGFQNVDYFRSFVRADQYFAKYPERLSKYHIIIENKIKFHDELWKRIINLRDHQKIFATSFSSCKRSDRTVFLYNVSDHRHGRSFETTEYSYTATFDRIIDNTFINSTLDRAQTIKNIPQYVECINPNRLPLPDIKLKLKILYLVSGTNKYVSDITKILGIDVTFKEDNNYSLDEHIKRHLGYYDIIIASDLHSSRLIFLNIESTEQCKDTGRDLTLLVSYKDESTFEEIGSKIHLYYIFASNLAPDAEIHQKEFRVLNKSYEFIHEDERKQKDYESNVSFIIGILSASLNIYNDALVQNNKPAINDLNMKTAEEFDNEYEIVDKQEEERRQADLAPIKAFDYFMSIVDCYLDYRKKGLITQIPEGLRIIEGENEIKIENIYQDRTLCSITYSKNYEQNNLRIFKIQTASKKGNLSSPQLVGLYTRKYENLENIPNRPDEKQANALLAIEKKINATLLPLNNEAWRKKCEVDRLNNLALERKRRRYNK